MFFIFLIPSFRDTLIVALTNSATSILAGFVIFSAIGYMAHVHNLPVDDIATDGECEQREKPSYWERCVLLLGLFLKSRLFVAIL